MKDMTIYCVQYKETTLGEDNVLETKSGVCEYAYYNEGDAIKKVKELAEEKVAECIDELGYEEDDVDTTENENKDYRCVNCGSNTYEYWVMGLGVI